MATAWRVHVLIMVLLFVFMYLSLDYYQVWIENVVLAACCLHMAGTFCLSMLSCVYPNQKGEGE